MAKKDTRDEGVKETDKVLAQTEDEIKKTYKQAEEEVQAKLDKYLEDFKHKDEKKREQLANGEITKEEYDKWRVGQIAIGQRWEEMKDVIAKDYTNAAEIAKSVTYGHMPEVYAINHNYGTFQVEKGSKVNTSYTMYNKDTVENLFKDGTFYPSPGKKVTKEINEGKQEAWDKKKVQSAMLQGILQGESVDKIAKRVAKSVGESDKKAAIRNARTMTTCVQNKGRLDSYKRAEGMGIEVMNEWIACLDERTREEHRLLDGQKVKIGEKFKVGGEEIEYPGDPSAPGYMVYNCRCCIAPYIPGVSKDMDYSNDLSDRYSKLGDETYDEWKNGKAGGSDDAGKAEERPKMNESAQKDYETLKKQVNVNGVSHNEVQKSEKQLTHDEIVKKISGGDETGGACASLSQTYCANVHGYDMTDFRGGESQATFANRYNSISMYKVANADVQTFKSYKAKDVAKVIKDIEPNKEYVLGAGKHSSVIRKTEDGELQYLELQSNTDSGWQSFTSEFIHDGKTYNHTVSETLVDRFKCTKSKSKFPEECYLVDISTIQMTDEYLEMLGYINTDTDKQMKGEKGGTK